MTHSNALSPDLIFLKEQVYDPCGFEWSNFQRHTESREYDACSFTLNGKNIQYRAAKITPTKVGQFVTIWKRNSQGITAPFDVQDELDFICITVKNEHQLGQFIFPEAVLHQKGIVSGNGKAGKRGIRVYAPWDVVTSKQAQATQRWQMQYFVALNGNYSIDALQRRLKELTIDN